MSQDHAIATEGLNDAREAIATTGHDAYATAQVAWVRAYTARGAAREALTRATEALAIADQEYGDATAELARHEVRPGVPRHSAEGSL